MKLKMIVLVAGALLVSANIASAAPRGDGFGRMMGASYFARGGFHGSYNSFRPHYAYGYGYGRFAHDGYGWRGHPYRGGYHGYRR